MGGQTGTQTQQTQSTTQLPPWINDAAQQNYGFAQQVASRPLQQYQGQMTPDVSDQLQQSWNTAATAGNAGLPQYNAATAGFMGALGQTPMSVNAGGNTMQVNAGGPTMSVNAGGPTMQVSNPGNAANAVSAGQIGNTDSLELHESVHAVGDQFIAADHAATAWPDAGRRTPAPRRKPAHSAA